MKRNVDELMFGIYNKNILSKRKSLGKEVHTNETPHH